MFVSKLFFNPKRSHWYCSYMDNNWNLSWKKNVEFHMKKIVFRQLKILLLCDLSLSFYEKIKYALFCILLDCLMCKAYNLFKSMKAILVRNKYLMAFTCSTVDVAACSINTKLFRKCHVCKDCNTIMMMKLQIPGYQENIVTVASTIKYIHSYWI